MRALIAEDDFASRKFLANLLKKYGFWNIIYGVFVYLCKINYIR